jgi:hypothetical protein
MSIGTLDNPDVVLNPQSQGWYYFYFTPPASLVGRTGLHL